MSRAELALGNAAYVGVEMMSVVNTMKTSCLSLHGIKYVFYMPALLLLLILSYRMVIP